MKRLYTILVSYCAGLIGFTPLCAASPFAGQQPFGVQGQGVPGLGGFGVPGAEQPPMDEEAAAKFFEELFKDVDFEQLAKDMEVMFKEIAAQEEKEKAQKADSLVDTNGKQPSGSDEATAKQAASNIVQPEQPVSSKTIYELFKDPDMVTRTVSEGLFSKKEVKTPSSGSLDAARAVLQELQGLLYSLQQNCITLPQADQERLQDVVAHYEQLTSTMGLLLGKKAYSRLLLGHGSPIAPKEQPKDKPKPDANQSIRNAILDALDQAKEALAKLQKAEPEPQDEELDSDADLITALASGQELPGKKSSASDLVGTLQRFDRTIAVPLIDTLQKFLQSKEMTALLEEKKKELEKLEKAAESSRKERERSRSSSSPWQSSGSDREYGSGGRGRPNSWGGRDSYRPFGGGAGSRSNDDWWRSLERGQKSTPSLSAGQKPSDGLTMASGNKTKTDATPAADATDTDKAKGKWGMSDKQLEKIKSTATSFEQLAVLLEHCTQKESLESPSKVKHLVSKTLKEAKRCASQYEKIGKAQKSLSQSPGYQQATKAMQRALPNLVAMGMEGIKDIVPLLSACNDTALIKHEQYASLLEQHYTQLSKTLTAVATEQKRAAALPDEKQKQLTALQQKLAVACQNLMHLANVDFCPDALSEKIDELCKPLQPKESEVSEETAEAEESKKPKEDAKPEGE